MPLPFPGADGPFACHEASHPHVVRRRQHHAQIDQIGEFRARGANAFEDDDPLLHQPGRLVAWSRRRPSKAS